jgi:CheY-like chemotaxis protein
MNRNLTILIAEDNEDDARLLQMAIRSLGINNPVLLLDDGAKIIDYLKGRGEYQDRKAFPFPSVLFLDLKLPRISGFEVLRWLKEHPKCSIIPVTIFSSSGVEADIQKAYELGANAYFVKPATFEDLKRMLQSAFEFWSWCAKPAVPERCTDD